MDVLAYSAFNQQLVLNQQIVEKTSTLSTKCSETAAAAAAAASLDEASICWVRCIEPCLLRLPATVSLWSCIPGLTGATQGFKVCDTATQFNCDKCCQWTVPDGVTRARFQLWGAGGGSGVGWCCGGSPFGSTGAYASVIIPVTAGDTYTICSGCAFCCFALACNYVLAEARVPGCPSFVIGNGLSNFCANGGQGRMGNWMASYGQPNVDRLAGLINTNGGSSICGAGSFYCSGSCGTCEVIPHVAGASYFGTTTSSTNPSIVYGIRGMWPCWCLTSNNYGCQLHPPIYGFESTSCCKVGFTCATCRGCCNRAQCCVLCVPGAGGWPSWSNGGCRCNCGDIGRMGMVCVTYC